PTDLQRQYVLHSRQAASRQLRLFASASALVSVIILMLAALGFYLLNRSEARRVATLSNAKTAEGDAQLGAILAIESLQIANIKEGKDALAGSMLKLRWGYQYTTMSGHSHRVISAAWSDDGRLASGSADGTIIIWDTTTGQPSPRLLHPKGG